MVDGGRDRNAALVVGPGKTPLVDEWRARRASQRGEGR